MTKYELSISPGYVPSWTVVDAVREIFQNAIDQQTTLPDNKMFFEYVTHTVTLDTTVGTLRIGNKSSVLEVKSLLLGASTKADDPNTIGQFGEGYKVATLVLTRLGKKITFYNYGAKEVWKPRFVKSRKYASQLLTFFVDKQYIWDNAPDNSLTITIEGITEDEYKLIVDSNLHLQDNGEVLSTAQGRILLDAKFKSMVFVNGLFVCEHEAYHHGYDFKPQYIKIDRDRKMANPFELEWMASKLWSDINTPEANQLAAQLSKKGAVDVKYVTSQSYTNIANMALEDFKEEHGEKAIPVATQAELEDVDGEYKPIIVPERHRDLIKYSPRYVAPVPKVVEATPVQLLEAWLDKYKTDLLAEAIDEFEEILQKL